MASMKMLELLVFVAAFHLCCVSAWEFRPITGEEEASLVLRQDPELLDIAARTGESVTVLISNSSTTAVVQERVNVNLGCLPLLQEFPGGRIQWYRISLDQNGRITDPKGIQTFWYIYYKHKRLLYCIVLFCIRP